ncbi:MAG: Asp-tRNA(Asn)/Glu-tRNA(Gln) amidotransferase subunit GatB [Pseudomonadota bacterium]
MIFESVIGLEVHAQLLTRTKIFCGCATEFGAQPNTNTCPVCLGMPGVLPVLNKKVVEYSMLMAIATNCVIAKESKFARKNYFYPDLPKGYQISQYDLPVAKHGHIFIDINGVSKKIGITRIHMEEDAGKLRHDTHRPVSFVDFNRAGVPLMEIVSEPDMRTPDEAGQYLRRLHSILRYLKICDGNMEEGSFRCDANVSIRVSGSKELGTRTELKNMNSFKNVEKAIAYEIERQTSLIEEGGKVIQETRLWDADKGITISMRGKEEAHDYRYFPDPDLVPFIIDDEWIEEIKKRLPELPQKKQERFVSEYGLPAYDAGLLTSSRELADYFEVCVAKCRQPKQASNWIMGTLLGMLNLQGKEISQSTVSAERLADLISLIDAGTISGKIAKTIFDEMASTGEAPQDIIKSKGIVQVTDISAIEEEVGKIVAQFPAEVEQYKGGKKKLFGFFVGQVMKATLGKANPQKVNECLERALGI